MLVFKGINDAWVYFAMELFRRGNTVDQTIELQNISFTISDVENNILDIRENFSIANYLEKMIISNDKYPFEHLHIYNQLSIIEEVLKEDRHSNKVTINVNYSEAATLQFYIRNNKLHATGVMKSNDIWSEVPYDVFYFISIQQLLAKRLKVEPGDYTHFTTLYYINENDLNNVELSIQNYDDAVHKKTDIKGLDILENIEMLSDIIMAYGKDKTKEEIKSFAIDICKQFNYLEEK